MSLFIISYDSLMLLHHWYGENNHMHDVIVSIGKYKNASAIR
jgi:hypothetical protein